MVSGTSAKDMATRRVAREPAFLLASGPHREPTLAAFGGVAARFTVPEPRGARPMPVGRTDVAPQDGSASLDSLVPESEAAASAREQALAAEFAERIAAAVGALRLTAERLAEQARSDALEVALLVARRIVEAELAAGIEPLFGIIRSVVRRAGDSRRIVVRLCPDDAARVEAAGGSKSLSGMAAAQIEVLADPALVAGDCVVDADFGMVDGKLDTRFEELRRILRDAVAEGQR